MNDPFTPSIALRSPHVQTILGSSRLRALGTHALFKMSTPLIIDAGSGVRLLGFHSKQSSPQQAKGTVALIHGWEGSSDSSYILSAGKYLFDKGFNIFRLNLRDHGDSHHLNEGLFHGALIEETAAAVQNIAALDGDKPFFLLGFSLGGNYALRIALKQAADAIPNLRHVIAVSPALDPFKATCAIDNRLPIYKYYFLSKWKKSLQKKQGLFPHRYDFRNLMQHKTCMGLTEALMPYYPEFPDYRSYFKHYTLSGDIFTGLTVPVTIIASQDDPVVPVADFHALTKNPLLTLYLHSHGGHCGFFESFPAPCWHEKKAYQIFGKHVMAS